MNELKFDFEQYDEMIGNIELCANNIKTHNFQNLDAGYSISEAIFELQNIYQNMNDCLEKYILSIDNMIKSLKNAETNMFIVDDVFDSMQA